MARPDTWGGTAEGGARREAPPTAPAERKILTPMEIRAAQLRVRQEKGQRERAEEFGGMRTRRAALKEGSVAKKVLARHEKDFLAKVIAESDVFRAAVAREKTQGTEGMDDRRLMERLLDQESPVAKHALSLLSGDAAPDAALARLYGDLKKNVDEALWMEDLRRKNEAKKKASAPKAVPRPPGAEEDEKPKSGGFLGRLFGK